MDISIFLAQVFGLYFLIAGVAFLMRPTMTKALIKKFSGDTEEIVIGGFISLIIGVPLILIHNIWTGTWEIVITILVWIVFLKGFLRVMVPDMVLTWSKQFERNVSIVQALMWLMVALGLYLLYVGFGMNT